MKPTKHAPLMAIVLIASVLFGSFNVTAQLECLYPRVLTPWIYAYQYSWPPGAIVEVFIDDSYTASEQAQFALGIANWNIYAAFDCSNVYFWGFLPMHFIPPIMPKCPLITRFGS